MKVLFVNGSTHTHGATAAAIEEMRDEFDRNGIESEIFHVPSDTLPCKACMACRSLGKCIIDDAVNMIHQKMEGSDGLLIASPVYYGSMSGSLVCFLNRLFVSTPKSLFKLKPAAALTVSRRLGNTTAFDAINKYFMVADMLVVGSNDWNEVHGLDYEEVSFDLEGRQTLRRLAKNMSYCLKICDLAKKAGLKMPEYEEKIRTSFIDGKENL